MREFNKERIFVIEIEGRELPEYINGVDLSDYLAQLSGCSFSCRPYCDLITFKKENTRYD